MTKENFFGIHVIRFRYFPLSKFEKVAYGHGILGNLKKNGLGVMILPFFFISFFVTTLIHCRKYDLIHAHWAVSGIIAAITKKIVGKPYLVTIRHHRHQDYPVRVYQYVLNYADLVIAPHPNLAHFLRLKGANNFIELPNIIERRKINSERVKKIKQEFGLEAEKCVAFVGRMDEFRDPVTLVRAIPLVLQHYKDVKFLLVGDGSLVSTLQEEIVNSGIERSVVLTGMRSEIEEILALSSIFVALSPIENIWSNSLVEAMDAGLACIVTKAGFSERKLKHRVNAYLVPPQDEKTLAKAIVELLTNDPLRKQIAHNGRNLIRKQGFTTSEIIQKLITAYQAVLNQKEADLINKKTSMTGKEGFRPFEGSVH